MDIEIRETEIYLGIKLEHENTVINFGLFDENEAESFKDKLDQASEEIKQWLDKQ